MKLKVEGSKFMIAGYIRFRHQETVEDVARGSSCTVYPHHVLCQSTMAFSDKIDSAIGRP